MARCVGCGNLIFVGGVNTSRGRYCSEGCAEATRIETALGGLTQEEVDARVMAEHLRPCPRCGRDGPVNVHQAVILMSFLFFTKFGRESIVACTPCARRFQLKALLGTFLMGWWGIPVGLAGTPFFLLWDLFLIAFPPRRGHPREAFVAMVLTRMAAEASQNRPRVTGAAPKFAPRRPPGPLK